MHALCASVERNMRCRRRVREPLRMQMSMMCRQAQTRSPILLLSALAGVILAACDAGDVSSIRRSCSFEPPSDPRGILIPSGTLEMGSDDYFPEERPMRHVDVTAFWIDATEVTNEQFAEFVADTGYVTLAERRLNAIDHPGLPEEMLQPGSAVFSPPVSLRDMADIAQWWRFTPGANWRHPLGPGSDLRGQGAHPVVHVVEEDARAYASWRGRTLPTEAQWEWAARGGMIGADYVWGDHPYPGGEQRANTWQGVFPLRDDGTDGYRGLAPVGCFPSNGYGLYDMAGNVWEWTTSDWNEGRNDGNSFGVIKGGSWLCAPNFCGRFRPAARQPGDRTLGSSHIGFRTVLAETDH